VAGLAYRTYGAPTKGVSPIGGTETLRPPSPRCGVGHRYPLCRPPARFSALGNAARAIAVGNRADGLPKSALLSRGVSYFTHRSPRYVAPWPQQADVRQKQALTSPYLDQPLLPLAIVLPRILAQIEVDLATADPAETRRLHQRAELIRELLTPRGRSPTPS
jgi:hypothetical protein